MNCGNLYIEFLGAAVIALGLLSLVIGFFRGLVNPKGGDGIAMPAFLLGAVGVVVGGWLMAAC
jgi:hypothetical protein